MKQITELPNEDRFLEEHEILDRIPISRRTLSNWKKDGKIPYVKIVKRVLYHWPSVSEALLRQSKGTLP